MSSLSDESDATALRSMIAWLSDLPWPKAEGTAVVRLFGAADEQGFAFWLAKRGQIPLADRIRAIVTSDGDGLQNDAWLRGVMGRAAVELAAVTAHPTLFDLIDHLVVLGTQEESVLADDLIARLAGASVEHPLWAVLVARCEAIYASRYFEQARRYHEANPDLPIRTRDIWSGQGHFPMADGWIHMAAATLWPAQYLAMLAAYPPIFQQAAMGSLHPLSIERACSLITAAEPVFSSEGEPMGPIAILAMLELLETELVTESVRSPAAAAASRDRVLDAIFARSDGAWIGRAWLQHLIWRGQPRRAGRTDEEVMAQEAFAADLREALSVRVPPMDDKLFDWIASEEPLWQIDRLLTESSVMERHGMAIAAAGILSEAVREGLVTATGRAEGLVSASPEARIVGAILSSIPSPPDWFEALWEATHAVRERLSFQAHRGLDNPAYPALAWALQALIASLDRGIDAPSFWRRLSAALLETEIIDLNGAIDTGPLPAIRAAMTQTGAALVKHGLLALDDFADFMVDRLDSHVRHAHLWTVICAEVPDAMALEMGRRVGAPILRQALHRALDEAGAGHAPFRFSAAVQADLRSFADRL